MTTECGKEFFIYVPTTNAVETLTQATIANCEETATSVEEKADLYDTWVKIPLTEQLVVYARLVKDPQRY